MPKSLTDRPPTSSAARFLNPDVAMRALHRDGLVAEPTPAPALTRRGCPWVKREFTLTPDADRAFTNLVAVLRECTGTRLNNSHVFRAVVQAIEPAFEAIRQEVAAGGPFRLPGNGRGSETRRQQFESHLSCSLRRAMRITEEVS